MPVRWWRWLVSDKEAPDKAERVCDISLIVKETK